MQILNPLVLAQIKCADHLSVQVLLLLLFGHFLNPLVDEVHLVGEFFALLILTLKVAFVLSHQNHIIRLSHSL